MMVCELQHESRCERRGLHHGDVEEPDQTSSGGRPLMRLPGGGCRRQEVSPSGAVPISSCACALLRGVSKDSSAGHVPEPGRWSAALAGLGEADMMSAGRRRARVIMDTS